MVQGHSVYMTQSTYCSVPVIVGTQIMSMTTVSSTARTISVTRNGVPLNSGDAYVYGETLVASLSSTSGEYLIQVTGGATVTGGGCSNTRYANAATSFVLPTTGSSSMAIVAAWTTAQTTPVSISSTFTLVAPQPTAEPTLSPTLMPNITPYPTYTATIPPSFAPTTTAVVPTTDDTTNSDSNASGLSSLTSSSKTGIGFMMAVTILGAIVGTGYLGAMYRLAHPDTRYISDKTFTITRIANVIVLICAIFTIMMASMWTKDSNSDYNYLGKPSWNNNLFAWHPILMVCGFFVSQLSAIASWGLLKNHFYAKLLHVFCQLAGLSTMIAGLWAVWKYKIDMKYFNYTTIHSWIGITTIAVYVFTFFWGSFMAILTRFYPDSILRKAFDLKDGHKTLGTLALMMTTMSILTGVMDQLPVGSCFPNLPAGVTYEQDAGQYYSQLPGSCKIAYGMAVFVFIATLISFIGIAFRGDSFGFLKGKHEKSLTQPGDDSSSSLSSLSAPAVSMIKNPQHHRGGDEENN